MANIISRRGFGVTTSIISGPIPPYLTREEVHRVIDPIENKRDHLLLNALWNTGMRISELLSERVGDVDSYLCTIKVKTLKKRNNKEKKIERAIPIPKDFINEWEDYAKIANLENNDKPFPVTRKDAWYLVRRYCRATGIDSKRSHPHVFRHSFAINCALQGIAPTVLAEWMGHANLSMVLLYARAVAKDTGHFRDGLEF